MCSVSTNADVRRSQFHLAELEKPDVLNAMLPGLGRDWTEILGGSLTQAFYLLAAYTMAWEAVAVRWARDDHALLQPAAPCGAIPVAYAMNLLKQKVAKKELELCGPLSAAAFSRCGVLTAADVACAGSASPPAIARQRARSS